MSGWQKCQLCFVGHSGKTQMWGVGVAKNWWITNLIFNKRHTNLCHFSENEILQHIFDQNSDFMIYIPETISTVADLGRNHARPYIPSTVPVKNKWGEKWPPSVFVNFWCFLDCLLLNIWICFWYKDKKFNISSAIWWNPPSFVGVPRDGIEGLLENFKIDSQVGSRVKRARIVSFKYYKRFHAAVVGWQGYFLLCGVCLLSNGKNFLENVYK